MPLITPKYLKLNEELHRRNNNYGRSGHKYVQKVIELSNQYNTQDVLDYGCGKCTLQEGLPFKITQYDPAIPEYAEHPTRQFDIVVCTDVMEHIEPLCLFEVLDDIRKLTKEVAFMTVATRKANKRLPDGRNTHLIVENKAWWEDILKSSFVILETAGNPKEFHIVGKPI